MNRQRSVMKRRSLATALLFALIVTTSAEAQTPQQNQAEQARQAELNRLGHEALMERQAREQQQQGQYYGDRTAPRAYVPEVNSVFAANDDLDWGIGYSWDTDIKAREDALAACREVARAQAGCAAEYTTSNSYNAAVAAMGTKTGKRLRWYFGDNRESLDQAMGRAMLKCLNDVDAEEFNCVPIVIWEAFPDKTRARVLYQ